MCVIEYYILGVGKYMTSWIRYVSAYIINCVSMGEATLFIHKDDCLLYHCWL